VVVHSLKVVNNALAPVTESELVRLFDSERLTNLRRVGVDRCYWLNIVSTPCANDKPLRSQAHLGGAKRIL